MSEQKSLLGVKETFNLPAILVFKAVSQFLLQWFVAENIELDAY